MDRALSLATLRFSLGHETTESDIERVATVFPTVVARVKDLGMALGRA
jgi:cysteine sulfinate desulfinase/cysteine desulfurase-like protein